MTDALARGAGPRGTVDGGGAPGGREPPTTGNKPSDNGSPLPRLETSTGPELSYNTSPLTLYPRFTPNAIADRNSVCIDGH